MGNALGPISLFVAFIAYIGRSFSAFINFFKKTFKLSCDIIFAFLEPRFFYSSLIYKQFLIIGIGSMPIVTLTGIFSGSVLALQSYIGFSRMGNIDSIPLVVALSITRELGPVMAGIIIAGRVSSTIASEVGAMRVTEQLDAMYVMGIEHIKYLLRPKLIAMIIFMPIVTLMTDMFGLLGGYFVSITKLNYNKFMYEKLTFDALKMSDVFDGLIKASAFGVIAVICGYIFGFYAKTGAHGVGLATKNAVVCTTVLILITNYYLTYLLFQ